VPNFLGRLQTFLFGAAIGRAASDSATPVLEPVRQHAWQKNQVKVLDPATAAEARAKGVISEADAEDDASRSGVGVERFGVLLRLAQSFPGMADLDKMSNRGLLDPGQLQESLTRHGIPADYHQHFIDLFSDLLSVADVAAGIQQGHLPNPIAPDGERILPNISAAVEPPGGALVPEAPDGQPPSDVPLTQVNLDPIKEAEGQGFDVDRLRVRANLSGLPPGPAELLTMWNRNEITEEAVDAGLREGHLKTKWSGAFKRMRWAVLGAAEYAGLHLRGWITEDEMNLGGALTGHTPEQMRKLYLNRGRPLAPVQAFTAWARGAPHPKGVGYKDRPGTFDEEDFLRALQQSDVRTEYGPILWHNRFAYFPVFQLGRLAQAKAIPEERARTILTYERYDPIDIEYLIAFWYHSPTATATNPWLDKAKQQWWTAAHKGFVKFGYPRSVMEAEMALLVPDLADRDAIFQWWTDERAVNADQPPTALP
jgi:hypothetical protein